MKQEARDVLADGKKAKRGDRNKLPVYAFCATPGLVTTLFPSLVTTKTHRRHGGGVFNAQLVEQNKE